MGRQTMHPNAQMVEQTPCLPLLPTSPKRSPKSKNLVWLLQVSCILQRCGHDLTRMQAHGP